MLSMQRCNHIRFLFFFNLCVVLSWVFCAFLSCVIFCKKIKDKKNSLCVLFFSYCTIIGNNAVVGLQSGGQQGSYGIRWFLLIFVWKVFFLFFVRLCVLCFYSLLVARWQKSGNQQSSDVTDDVCGKCPLTKQFDFFSGVLLFLPDASR